MTLLRDLGRRKLRTTLTILGITIGIWALVVFGSMSNKINAIVDGGSTFYEDKVTVMANGSGMGLFLAHRIATTRYGGSLELLDREWALAVSSGSGARPHFDAVVQLLMALGRIGDPGDIASAVAYLALDAPYVTGQILAVDGGYLAHF